jgi:hypothetical protein
MSHSVIRVRTRETICHPDIAQLVMRGARKAGLPQPAAVLAEMVDRIHSHGIGVFIGFEGHDPKGVLVAELPFSAFHLAPTVSLAYSEGGRALSIAVGARLREWLQETGFDNVLAGNMRHTDRAFMRGLAHVGRVERVGGFFRFSF